MPLPVTTPSLVLPAVTPADSGLYSARGETAAGAFATEQLPVRIGYWPHQRVLNISTRVALSPSRPIVIVGFVVEGDDGASIRKPVLIRAIGPALTDFDVSQPLPRPRLTLFDSEGVPVALPESLPIHLNSNNASARAGAFALPIVGENIVRVYHLKPGAYTAHVTAEDAESGEVLVEIYEVPEPTSVLLLEPSP